MAVEQWLNTEHIILSSRDQIPPQGPMLNFNVIGCMPVKPCQMFAGLGRKGTFLLLHCKVCSLPYPQTLDLAGEACK